MGSINISITEEVYSTLKQLRKGDESFSDIIRRLVRERDLGSCYGLLNMYKEDLEIVENEALRARKTKPHKANV